MGLVEVLAELAAASFIISSKVTTFGGAAGCEGLEFLVIGRAGVDFEFLDEADKGLLLVDFCVSFGWVVVVVEVLEVELWVCFWDIFPSVGLLVVVVVVGFFVVSSFLGTLLGLRASSRSRLRSKSSCCSLRMRCFSSSFFFWRKASAAFGSSWGLFFSCGFFCRLFFSSRIWLKKKRCHLNQLNLKIHIILDWRNETYLYKLYYSIGHDS